MRTYGKKEWLIADCFYDSKWNGQVSHEAVCVLNTSEKEAHIAFTLFFEDSEPITGFSATCGSMRTHHIRMDKILNDKGDISLSIRPMHCLWKATLKWFANIRDLTPHNPKWRL